MTKECTQQRKARRRHIGEVNKVKPVSLQFPQGALKFGDVKATRLTANDDMLPYKESISPSL
ncbi:hypothetical protein BgiBS90_002331, partial [Biomphalaria glabrata]